MKTMPVNPPYQVRKTHDSWYNPVSESVFIAQSALTKTVHPSACISSLYRLFSLRLSYEDYPEKSLENH